MMNMAPVTASTKIDNPKIDCAGVEAGAKMFVGLSGGPAFWATAGGEQNTTKKIWTPADLSSFCRPTFAVDRSELRASPNPRCKRLLAGYMFTATLSPPAGFATEAFSSYAGPR